MPARKLPKAPKDVAPDRAFRGVPAEERRRERREKLLDAGFKLFGSRGYHHVTVKEICVEARLTERYFYESFPNLEALFGECYAVLHAELQRLTFAALAAAPRNPEALAEAAVRTFFEYVAHDPRRGQLLLVDSLLVGQEMTRRAEGSTQDYVMMVRSYISLLLPNAERELGLSAELIAQGLVGVAVFLFWRWKASGFLTPVEELIKNVVFFYRAMIHMVPESTSPPPRSAPR